MSANYSNYHLQKLVNKLNGYKYSVRFERGNFKTGYCILESKKVIVVNRFHDIEARIDTLRQILSQVRS